MRVRGGRAFAERAIAPEAYAAYARGRLSESGGDWKEAAVQYRLVLQADPQSVEALIRLAGIYCTRASAYSTELFTKAQALDPSSFGLWLELAKCDIARHQYDIALKNAEQALNLDPVSSQALSSIMIASSALNRTEPAMALLRAALAAAPQDVRLWRLMFENESASPAERRYAAARLQQLRPLSATDIPEYYVSGANQLETDKRATAAALTEALDQALREEELDIARRLATRLGLNPEQLALTALEKGAHLVASAQADLLLAIDPNNSTAWIVGLIAADESKDPSRVTALLRYPPTKPLPLGSPLIEPMVALLRRHTAFEYPFSTPLSSAKH